MIHSESLFLKQNTLNQSKLNRLEALRPNQWLVLYSIFSNRKSIERIEHQKIRQNIIQRNGICVALLELTKIAF